MASLVLVYMLPRPDGLGAKIAEVTRLAGGTTSAEASQAGTGAVGAPAGGGGAKGCVPAAGGNSLKDIMTRVRGMLRGSAMVNPSGDFKAMTLLAEIRDQDLLEALKMAEETANPQQKLLILTNLLSRWARTDPQAAMKYAEEKLSSQGTLIQMGKMGVVTTWAEQDPEAVWAWYQKQGTEGAGGKGGIMDREVALMAIFSSMTGRDLDSTFKKYAELATVEERQAAFTGIAQAASDESSRNRVMEELAKIKDTVEQKEAREVLLSQWALMEPEKVAAYVEGLTADERKASAGAVGQALMLSDPKMGAEFILKNGDSDQRAENYATIIQTWAQQDPNAAGLWLGKQPQGPELDEARSSFAGFVQERDPESAMEWAKTITGEIQRATLVFGVYESWKKTNATAAEAALARSGISAEMLELVRKSAEL